MSREDFKGLTIVHWVLFGLLVAEVILRDQLDWLFYLKSFVLLLFYLIIRMNRYRYKISQTDSESSDQDQLQVMPKRDYQYLFIMTFVITFVYGMDDTVNGFHWLDFIEVPALVYMWTFVIASERKYQ